MSNPIANIKRRLKAIKLSSVQTDFVRKAQARIEHFKEQKAWKMLGETHHELTFYIRSIVDGKGYANARYRLNDDCTKLEFIPDVPVKEEVSHDDDLGLSIKK